MPAWRWIRPGDNPNQLVLEDEREARGSVQDQEGLISALEGGPSMALVREDRETTTLDNCRRLQTGEGGDGCEQ